MRYFIGNLIRGEAAEYYKATCAELSARFGIEDVSLIVPPHITVKSGFDRHTVEAIDDIVSANTAKSPVPVKISQWNRFTTRTIFLESPEVSPELKNYVVGLLGKLRSLNINFAPQEEDFRIRMSVARFLKPDQHEAIWTYLHSCPIPEFDIKFDNLTIFSKEKREDKAWKILKTLPLMG